MTTLKDANRQLYRRCPDEIFHDLGSLKWECECRQGKSAEVIVPASSLALKQTPHGIDLRFGEKRGEHGLLNDWSFGQLCRGAHLQKSTINRFSPKLAVDALNYVLPNIDGNVRVMTSEKTVRSITSPDYTRLWDAEVIDAVTAAAVGFVPPHTAVGGGTGLYSGEQDMFLFMIDPTGWIDIQGESFAPGFFVTNSEVGSMSVGIQAFWFQLICKNHIVWSATDVVKYRHRHTKGVKDGLSHIVEIIGEIRNRRDSERDSFADLIKRAMVAKLGDTDAEVLKVLDRHGIGKRLAEDAIKIAARTGGLTIFALVDALTKLSQEHVQFANYRSDADIAAGRLLSLLSAMTAA